jgi:ABC-type cobalamin transport system ATPase subunit
LDEGKVKKFGKTEDILKSRTIEEVFSVTQHECEFDGEKRIIFR